MSHQGIACGCGFVALVSATQIEFDTCTLPVLSIPIAVVLVTALDWLNNIFLSLNHESFNVHVSISTLVVGLTHHQNLKFQLTIHRIQFKKSVHQAFTWVNLNVFGIIHSLEPLKFGPAIQLTFTQKLTEFHVQSLTDL